MTTPGVPPPFPPPSRRRSEVEIRWRQFRNPPRPILRAILSSLIVATVLGIAYLVLVIEGQVLRPWLA